MTWLVIYLLAYFMAGAPTITSVEGWVVFGVVACVLALASAIASIETTVQIGFDDDEEDEGHEL